MNARDWGPTWWREGDSLTRGLENTQILEIHTSSPLKVKVAQSCPTLCDLMDYTVHGILQARKNTGVGSLSFLQGIFPTQGLLHCRRILYQLSYQGSPNWTSQESCFQLLLTFPIFLTPLPGWFTCQVTGWLPKAQPRHPLPPRNQRARL